MSGLDMEAGELHAEFDGREVTYGFVSSMSWRGFVTVTVERRRARRRGLAPVQWLIDEEAHVQAYLWAVLHPIFGGQLLDEQYLPGFGLKQPRYDFGTANLGLIVWGRVLGRSAWLVVTIGMPALIYRKRRVTPTLLGMGSRG